MAQVIVPLAALRLAYGDQLGGMLDTRLQQQIAARKTELEILQTVLSEKVKRQTVILALK